MRKDLMNILACPVCREPLALTATETAGDEIIAGALKCPACGHTYPIEDGIPRLLPPEGATPADCSS